MKLKLFIPLEKIDEEKQEAWGVLAEERVDKANEIFDYTGSRPHFEEWSRSFEEVTKGKSKGNVRYMHGSDAVGKLVAIQYDDEAKKIRIGAKIVDEKVWEKIREGVLTGFSVGGSYVKRDPDAAIKGAVRYIARPAEASVVDNPCMYGATFEAVKADGSIELRKFVAPVEHAEVLALAKEWCEAHIARDFTRDGLALKRDIVQRWTAALENHGAPSARATAKVAASVGLKKGLYDVSSLASCLSSLDWLLRSAEAEAEAEGDNSPVPAQLQAAIRALGSVLVAMTVEEVGELHANDDVEESPLEQFALSAMAFLDLHKVGARHSRADLKRVNGIHNMAVELGADCAGPSKVAGATPGQEGEDVDAQALAKALGDALGDKENTLTKAFTAIVDGAVKPLGEQVAKATTDLAKIATDTEELAKRVKKLEDDPAPPKGVVRAVEKAEDVGGQGADKGPDAAKVQPSATVTDDILALTKSAQTSEKAQLIGRRSAA